jgi:protoporphyrinogen/coproporphyrinogen III oxidase
MSARAREPVAVLGAGLAGLVAANELQRRSIPFRVFEAGKQIAGLAKSFRDEAGFSYDFGAHFITNRLAAALGIGGRCRDVRFYSEAVWLGGRPLTYPWGLAGSPTLLFSVLRSKLAGTTRPPTTATEAFTAEYGRDFARLVAIPLIERWSGIPASELASTVAEKIPGGVMHLVQLSVASRLTARAVAHGYCNEQPESIHVWHVYPEKGLSTLCEHLASHLSTDVEMQSPVERIIVEDERVRAIRVKGEEVEVSAVMSTAPVNVLAKLVEGTDALAPLARFRYRPMTFVNLRFEGRGLLPSVVLWHPEADFPFFRLTEAPLSMPWLAPDGMTMLTADLSCDVGDDIWKMPDDQIGELCLEHIARIVPDARKRYRGCGVLRTPLAYPIFLTEYEHERRAFAQSSGVAGLASIGRNGEFAHILMEDVYWRTLRRTRELADWLDAAPSRSTLSAQQA